MKNSLWEIAMQKDMQNFDQTERSKKDAKILTNSPDCDVEDVASDRGGYSHVAETLAGDNHGGD